MASSSKKWWLATGAVSVVVAGLMILGLPTCNRMVKEHQTDSEQKDSVAVVSNDDRVRALTDSINELKQDLRDTKELLDDCRESKKPRQKPRKPQPRKPQPRKPQPRKPQKDTVVVVVEKPVNVSVPEQNVNVNNCGDGATVVVGNNNNVVVQSPTPAVIADSLKQFKRTTTVTVTVKKKTRQRIYY